MPPCLDALNRLESALISKRLLFKKIMIMPKGQFPKIKGAICNIPIDLNDSCNVLPRNETNSGILFVKLKRKLQFKGHVYFQPVSPSKLNEALLFLKVNNHLYADIEIDLDQIPEELLNLSDDNEMDIEIQVDENLETTPNHLDSFRCPAVESCTLPLNVNDDLFEIAPGENKTPHSILRDEFCEELAFPNLFPSGKFGYKAKRDIPLSPVKYFNQRLLNYTQRFASNTDYIFFAQYVLQIASLFSSINMAFKKVSGNLTAGMFSNYKEAVQSFVSKDQGYTFMNHVKGTPAYWKRFLLEVLAMIRQLGCPTFFLTLSCADLFWVDLVSVIAKVNNLNLSKSDIERMTYMERCEILNKNPVLMARHFQYRIELLFAEILMIPGGPLGDIIYYAIRVEFQFRGSPHIHSFIWILNAPILNVNNIEKYIEFVDSVIHATVPDENEDHELHNLVKTYQLHQHSRSCRKYKNMDCRYGFGQFFTEKTIIALPLPKDMPVENRSEILSKRNACLSKVKGFINTYLHPKSPEYLKGITIHEILDRLSISVDEYYEALAISGSDDFEIHVKRFPDSCFINNYNPTILKAWQANMDLQVVHNYYKAVSYMCAYFSKSETESSDAIKLASREVRNMKMNQKDAMFKLASAFTNSRQLSVQEAIYHCLLKLRWIFPAVLFINTNLPGERIRVCKSEKELQELDPESTDVFKSGIIEKYMDRPNESFMKGKYASVANICLALFASYYRVDYVKESDDTQPDILTEEFSEAHHELEFDLPKTIPLMSSKTKMKRRKVKQVLRFPSFNKELKPEKYAHHLLLLYYPCRSENELQIDNSYCRKLSDPNVLKVVETNRALFEPNADEINAALSLLASSSETTAQNNDEKPNDDSEAGDENETLNSDAIFGPSCSSSQQTHLLSNQELCTLIQTLNTSQRQVFDSAYSWAACKVKAKLAALSFHQEPLRLFLTGGAGSGKSHLARAIFHAWEKTFSNFSSDLTKIKVLTIAPTGVAAINVNGTTVNSALAIPANNNAVLPAISSDKKSLLRNMYSELQAIIIDEVSMISNIRLMHVHVRLCEIFGCLTDNKLANLSVIVVGDLLQLPPIRQAQIFALFTNEFMNLCHPWYWFQCCELTECMRQQDDEQFISLLNAVRVGKLSDEHIALLKSRIKDHNELPDNAVYIYATNAQKDEKNSEKLDTLNFPQITLNASDTFPKNITDSQIDRVLSCSAADAGGLSRILILKKTARVMLTSNIDINDRLINGQMGEIFDFHYTQHNTIDIIFVKFDDQLAGLNTMRKSHFAMQHNVVPIYRIESRISTGKASSVTRVQFPLTLAYACTVHKVQGLTLDKAVFSFDLGNQKCFNNGQVYVALSRVRKLNDLFILGEPSANAVRADQDTLEEYERLRSECNFFKSSENISSSATTTTTIALLNTRSLQLHSSDIAKHMKLNKSSIICMTETQLNTNESTCKIEELFPSYDLVLNNSADKFCSLAMLVKDSLHVDELLKLEGVQLTNITFPDSQFSLKVLLLYRKKSQSFQSLREVLTYIIQCHTPDMILGDFNLNLLSQDAEAFLHFMTGNSYIQIVSEPTHMLGSLLDHVYVTPSLSNHISSVNVEPMYFSDHDAVIVELN